MSNEVKPLDLSQFIMPFGRYKGKKMEDIPADYLLHINEKLTWLHGKPKDYILENLAALEKEVADSKN